MQAQATAQLIRDEAALFLGRRPTDEEMEWALPRAQKKLAWIIEREGDAGGIRQQPWYLGKLVEEAIVEEGFSQYTLARWRFVNPTQNKETRRMTNEAINIKA